MKKSFYFYTSIALSIILGLVIGNYIFGWTTPLANPPSSNLSAPINTGASNQSKSGYLAVGTSTTPTYPLEVGNQLRVWGQLISKVAPGTAPFVVDSQTKVANLNADTLDGYDSADLLGGSVEIPMSAATYFYNGGEPFYCKKKVVGTWGNVTFSNINENLPCVSGKYCLAGECNSTTKVAAYYMYVTTANYNGNLGGRSGSDNKCDTDANKPIWCTGPGSAFLSVNDNDEIRDLPTTKGLDPTLTWIWASNTNGPGGELGSDLADILDGNINIPEKQTLTNVYTGSYSDGSLNADNCTGWTVDTSTIKGRAGRTDYTDYHWLDNLSAGCNNTYRLMCFCKF